LTRFEYFPFLQHLGINASWLALPLDEDTCCTFTFGFGTQKQQDKLIQGLGNVL